jgi:hypothetical protein
MLGSDGREVGLEAFSGTVLIQVGIGVVRHAGRVTPRSCILSKPSVPAFV